MIVNLSGTVWEIIPTNEYGTENKAILRGKTDKSMTIDMSEFDKWHYDNLEDMQHVTEKQAKIIYFMQKWGNTKYETIKDREGKIIFS